MENSRIGDRVYTGTSATDLAQKLLRSPRSSYFNYQKTWAKWTSGLLYAVLIGFVARTGYLGGQLVFKHGAGIELALPEFGDQPKE